MRKEERKKISFVTFVMAVFFAGLALTVFHESVWVLFASGALLFAASCFFIWDRAEKEQSASGKASEVLLADRMAELMRGNEKAEKGVYIAVKKQHEAMEEGMAMLEARLNEVVKAQESAMKTLVLYNKENARQIALSEREELERLCKEWKDGLAALTMQLQEKNFVEAVTSPAVEAAKQTGNRIYEELHESNETVLAELQSITDSIEELQALLSELVHSNVHEKFNNLVNELPRVPLDVVVSPESLKDEPEAQRFDEEPEEAEELEAQRLDEVPEETMPEEIEEPAPIEESEPVSEVASEELTGASGVDLSDPNKTLSADDIAALFAAMGN